MYARVCDATGWTWDYVGEFLTLPRLRALVKRWNEFPPVSESVAALLGKPTHQSQPAANQHRITNADVVKDMRVRPQDLKWTAISG